MKPIKMFDVFSGIGGAVEAARGLPLRSVGGCEWGKSAAAVYWSNNGHYPYGNIWEVDPAKIEPFDLLFASPDCSPYSKMGKQTGLQHPASRAVFGLEPIIAYHKPKAIVFENVCEWPEWQDGRALAIISSAFERHSYHSLTDKRAWRKLNSAKFGIPTQRKRFFGVMLRKDFDPDDLKWPDPSLPMVPLSTVLQPEDEVRHLVCKRKDMIPCTQKRPGPYSPRLVGYYGIKFRDKMVYNCNGPSSTFVRANSGLSSTSNLYMTGSGIVRKLSIREMLRAMSYGDHFVIPMPFGIAARLIGSSLVPAVLHEVFKMAIKVISKGKATKCA